MNGWDWLTLALSTLAVAGRFGRELLVFLRSRSHDRVVEHLAREARPGTRVRFAADGGLDLVMEHRSAEPKDDDASVGGRPA